jgi:hypothetical protein
MDPLNTPMDSVFFPNIAFHAIFLFSCRAIYFVVFRTGVFDPGFGRILAHKTKQLLSEDKSIGLMHLQWHKTGQLKVCGLLFNPTATKKRRPYHQSVRRAVACLSHKITPSGLNYFTASLFQRVLRWYVGISLGVPLIAFLNLKIGKERKSNFDLHR